MKGVNAQAAAMQGTMGRTAAVTQRVLHPYNQLNESLVRNKIGMRELGMVARDTNGIWAHNQRIMRATGQVTYDAAGNAQVMVNRMGELNGAMAGVGGRIRTFNTFLQAGSASLVKWGKNTQWAGRQLTVGFTVPLMLLGRQATKTAEDFDREMTRIIKVTKFTAEEGTRAFDMQVDAVEAQAKRVVTLGASMGFMAQETSSAIAEFAQMGYIGQQLNVLSDAALRFSRTSGTDLPTALELTRITAQAFNTDLEDLNGTFARLNLIENNTALSMEELSQSIPVVAGVASNLNMEIEETAGLLAIMKESGIGAREGATALRTGLVRIVQEATLPAREAFQGIGLDLVDMQTRMNDAAEGGGDVMYFLEELSGHLANLKAQGEGAQGQVNEFVGAMGKLVGTRQAARFLSLLEELPNLSEEGSAAQRAFLGVTTDVADALRVYQFELDRVQNSAAGMAETLRAEINVELAELGEAFLEVANRGREMIRDVLRWFNNLDEGVKRAVMTLGGFLAVLGPIIMLGGLLANALGNLLRGFLFVLPKMAATTIATRAQAIAFDNEALSIYSTNNAIKSHIAHLGALRGAMAATAPGTRGVSKNVAANAAAMMSPGGLRVGMDAATAAKVQGAMGGAGAAASAGKIAIALNAAKAALAAMAGPLAAIAAIVGGIAILADPQAFFETFKQSMGPAFDSFMGAVERVKESFSRVVELFRQAGPNGEGGSGLTHMANILARIAGLVGGLLLNALTLVLNLFESLVPVFESVLFVVEGIGSILQGDWSGFVAAIDEAVKAMLRGIVGVVASLIEFIADALANVPGFGGIKEEMYEIARGMREWDKIASGVDTTVSELEQSIRDASETQGDLTESIKEGEEYQEELVQAKIITGNETKKELINNNSLNDEMKRRLWILLDQQELQIELNNLIREQKRLEAMDIEPASAEEFYGGRLLGKNATEAERARNKELRAQAGILNRIEEIRERIKSSDSRAAAALGTQADAMRELMGDSGEYADNLSDANNEAESIARNYASALRNEISNVMSGVADAVKQSLSDEEDSVMNVLDLRLDNIKEEFNARKDALRERLSEEKDALKERLDDEKDAFKERMSLQREGLKEAQDDRMEKIKDAHEAEQERLDERIETEREGIENSYNARIEALEDVQEEEDEIERMRQRAFEREQARIAQLKGLRTGNIDMQLALARGELSRAAILREEISAETRQFRLDEAERERGWVKEDEKRARDERIEILQDELRTALDLFKVRAEGWEAMLDEQQAIQIEHLKEREKEEQKSLERQQKMQEKSLEARQKATEKALDKHQKSLEDSLDKEQKIAEKRIETERNAAQKGFDARERAINNTLREWERVNPATEAEYRRHLDQLRKDLGVSKERWSNVVSNFSEYTGNEIGRGFQTADRNAKQALGEDAKWDEFAEDIISNFASGVNSGLNRSFKELAELFGITLPEASSGRGYRHRGPGGRTENTMHSGGVVNGPPAPGLKPDETPAVLQRGEYVIKRDAVKKLGPKYLDQLNNADRANIPRYSDEFYHEGGPVDWQGRINSSSDPHNSGHILGEFLSYLGDHGAFPTGSGATGSGRGFNLTGINNLTPPDSDATWRMPGGWTQGLHPGVVHAVTNILNSIPGGQRITSAFRPGSITTSGSVSQHSVGEAVDIQALARRAGGTMESERMGDMMAAAFRNHPNSYQVLWKTMRGGNHYDHVHAGFKFHDGGLVEERPDFNMLRFGNQDLMSSILGHYLGKMGDMMGNRMAGFLPSYAGANQPAATGPIQQYAKQLLSNYGWPDTMWGAVDNIVSKESSWRPNAQNPNSTAYGLFQFLNSTWGTVQGSKTSDPYEQIRLGYKYIQQRYGNPANAWDFWQRNQWYHGGGEVKIPALARGATINYDNTIANLHKGERVLTSNLSAKLDKGLERFAEGDVYGDTIIKIDTFYGTEENIDALATRLERINDKRSMARGKKRRIT